MASPTQEVAGQYNLVSRDSRVNPYAANATNPNLVSTNPTINPFAANATKPGQVLGDNTQVNNTQQSNTGVDPHINPKTGQWDDNYYQSIIKDLQGGQAQDQQLINDAYGQSESYLNQAENQLNADYPTIQGEINAQGQLNNQLLDNSKTSALNQTGQQATTANQRQESALTKARRLYGELQRGYNQRFGGASSAGDAATEISNQERLRQEGTTRQDYGNTMRAIELQNQEIESNYNTGKLQLQQQTQQSLNEAQRDFQNKLLTISQNRALIGQAKAEARLASLQELRNNIYQINMQNMQFQQQLEAQKQAGQQQLQQFSTQSQGAVSAAQGATDAYNPNIQSNLQTGAVQFGQNTPLELYGNISSGTKDELNKYNPGLTF